MGATRDRYEAAMRAYNEGDLDAFARAHAADAVLETPAGTFRGREAIRAYWAGQRAAFPDLVLTLVTVLEEGAVVASEWTWAGTNRGRLHRAGRGSMEATGRRVELRGMEVARFRDGLIVEYRMYWDSAAIARQLGVAPVLQRE